MVSAVPQLMFHAAVAEVITLWSRAFPDLSVEVLAGGDTPSYARVTVAGQPLMLFDSPVRHEFNFTPAISILVNCDQADEVSRLAEILGQGGEIFMPLDSYPFSPCYTWISDRFGVSWQLMQSPAEEAGA